MAIWPRRADVRTPSSAMATLDCNCWGTAAAAAAALESDSLRDSLTSS